MNEAQFYRSKVKPPGISYLEQLLKELKDMLAGAGIASYPGAAAPADGVSLAAVLRRLHDDLGDPSGNTLASLTAKLGDIARSLDLILGSRWDAGGDLGTDIANILAGMGVASGVLQEQPRAVVNIDAVAAAETDILNLSAADTRYIVRHLRLKCANPGANTVTVWLYEMVNNVLIVVDTFDINAANFGTYHSLMDMFGLPCLAGDRLQITARASAGGPYAVTGQYSYAKTI